MTEQLHDTQDYTGWLIDEAGARLLLNDTAKRARRAGLAVERKSEKWGPEGKYRGIRIGKCAAVGLVKVHAQKQLWTVNADLRDNAGLPMVNLEIHNYAE